MGQKDLSVLNTNNLVAELWRSIEDMEAGRGKTRVMMAHADVWIWELEAVTIYPKKEKKYFNILKTNMNTVLLSGWISALYKGFLKNNTSYYSMKI